jgi:pimeloyl-ACP methyl ester carboxylesterase
MDLIDHRQGGIMNTKRIIGAWLDTAALVSPSYAGRLGFELFGRPVRRKMKEKEAAFLDTAEAFSFRHAGVKIQGYRWGNGDKKVLLLHGWQSNSGRWHAGTSLLNDGATVYAIDAPGHGRSGGVLCTAPLLARVILDLEKKVGRFNVIVGHSFGAFSAIYAVSRLTELRPDKVVALATPGELGGMLEYFQGQLGLKPKTVEAIAAHIRKTFGSPVEDFTTASFASRLEVPSLIVHDPKDPIVPYRHAEVLHQNWRNSSLVAIAGAGHNLNAAGVWNKVADFIRA